MRQFQAIQLLIQTHLAKTRFATSVLPLFKLAKFVQNHQLAEICVPGALDAVFRRISLRLFCAFTWARFGVALLVIGWFIHLRATTRGRTGFDIGAFD